MLPLFSNQKTNRMSSGLFFSSKLLLFGEYTLLLGSPGLAMPYPVFGGTWRQFPDGKVPYRDVLLDLTGHLETIGGFDTAALRGELDAGWGFDGNIPTGYGLGSSGALCAAVYHRFCKDRWPAEAVHAPQLRERFAAMEHFFHGNSSGVDPLVSYLNKALLLRSRTEVVALEGLTLPQSPRIFLLDTGRPRQTAPLVQGFLQRCQEENYQNACLNELTPNTAEAISALLAGDTGRLWNAWSAISRFQRTHFAAMIPEDLLPLWETGLDTGEFSLKLCGAGGGGFLLGLAKATLDSIEVLDPYREAIRAV
jgi:mevalonate kinase